MYTGCLQKWSPTEMSLYDELHRPQFHFSPKKNWMNDPNGLVYQDGVWHLFFQYNPESNIWGNMTWGHAVSDDLMHWQQVDHALHPDEMGTMFSGCAIVDKENTAGFGKDALLFFYTAAGDYVDPRVPFTQCIAYSTDNGKQLTKYEGNPVVEWIAGTNRDPKVIWHEGSAHWIMALYLDKDRYCLLRSTDLTTWEQFQELRLEGDDECPDFFPLTDESGEERWILWGASGIYKVGSFDGTEFTPDTQARVGEHGPAGYAAQTWSDTPDGRRIQISWLRDGLYPEMPFNHHMSIPVELTLAGSGNDVTLVRWPVPEVESVRAQSKSFDQQVVVAKKPYIVETDAKLLDVSFDISKQDSSSLYVIIRGQYMMFDWTKGQLSFMSSGLKSTPAESGVPIPEGDRLSVRLLIDKTSIEIFLNQGMVSASFNFLPGAYIDPLVIQSRDSEQTIDNLEVHELSSIWT